LNFRRINPLHWTPFIQQCHDDLLTNPETDNDIYLARLSALQRISENIKHSGIQSLPQQPRTWNGPLAVHFNLLLSELQQFKASLPESLSHDGNMKFIFVTAIHRNLNANLCFLLDLLILNYHTIEMYLFDICFCMPPTILTHLPTLQRTDVLSMCLTATQAFLHHYFSIHNKPYITFSRMVTSQMYFAMMILSKFSLFHVEDWNINEVEIGMDLSTVVDRVAMMMEETSARFDHLVDKRPWLQLSQKIRQIRVRFDRVLASENSPIHSLLPAIQGRGTLSATDAALSFNQFDLLDDGFWQNLSENTYHVQ
jgi:hypothetical protein